MQRRHLQNLGWFTATHAHRACSLGNVNRCYPVSVVLKTAALTTEKGLAFPVFPGSMSAAWALLASMRGVYCYHSYSSQRSFVFQKETQLAVGPEVVQMSFLFTSLCRVEPKALQILNSQSIARFQAFNNAPRQSVQSVVYEALLFSAKPFPKVFESFGAFGIELASYLSTLFSIMKAFGLNKPTRKLYPSRECSQNLLSKVNPYHFPRSNRNFRAFQPKGKVDIPFSLCSFEQYPTLYTSGFFQHFPLVVAKLHRYNKPSLCGCQRNRLASKRKGALIKSTGIWFINPGPAPFLFTHSSNRLHCKVCAQSHFTKVFIDKVVQPESTKFLTLFSYLQGVITPLSKKLHSIFQSLNLFKVGPESATKCQSLHKHSIAQYNKKGGGALLPMPKGRGFCALRIL